MWKGGTGRWRARWDLQSNNLEIFWRVEEVNSVSDLGNRGDPMKKSEHTEAGGMGEFEYENT